MTDSRRHAVGRFGWLLLPIVVGGTLVAGLIAAAVAITLRVTMLVITPPKTKAEEVVVLAVDRAEGTVTLSDHVDAIVPGSYSLYFSGSAGRAKIGDILRHGEGSVTRRLLAEERGTLRRNIPARVSGWFYSSPGEFPYEHEDTVVQTDLGHAAAWLFPARRPDVPGVVKRGVVQPGAIRPGGIRHGVIEHWVIQVHGRGVDRTEALRAVPVFHEAGYTSLLISYRNDGVAPASDDGRYALGDTEWRDVDAAMRFALDRGATDIVLMGWSMGGALVLQAATRSAVRSVVRGVILDSPVVDWVTVLNHQAGSMRIPKWVRSAAYTLISRPWGRLFTGQSAAIDLDRLDFVRRAGELTTPILLMHSESDNYVPSSASRELAKLRPDIVTFESFSGAGHTRLWNYDQDRWNGAIGAWLGGLKPTKRGVTPPASREPVASSVRGEPTSPATEVG